MTIVHTDQSEDCLVLNVWTPAADGRRRPVMFRIHGGGYGIGSGAWSWHDGANIARRGDVVVVTVNHRLNGLGYLHLEDIGGARYAGSGNAGMLDLVLALQWVRDNIAAFGGDPGKVTIFGESGGGAKVATLLAMPSAKGLFHRAIIESGAQRTYDRQAADRMARGLLARLQIGPESLDKLADVPLPKFYEAVQAAGIEPMAWAPVVDGVVAPQAPGAALAAGASADVPLIIGSNLQEAVTFSPQLLPMDEAGLRRHVEALAPGRTEEVIAHYRRRMPEASPGELYFAIEGGQGMFRRAAAELMDAKVRGGRAPVYAYLLAWRSRGAGGKALAGHGIEVPLTMDNVQTSGSWVADDPNAQMLAEQMSEAWIAFARSGDPSHPGVGRWRPFGLPARDTMVFDLQSRMAEDPYGEAALWRWAEAGRPT